MPGEIGVAQAMRRARGFGDLRRAVGVENRFAVRAHAPVCRTRPGTCGNCPRPAVWDDSNNAAHPPSPRARLDHRRGQRFARTGSGVVFGTSTSRPSTLTLIFSTGGGAGLGSVVAAVDMLVQRCGLACNWSSTLAHGVFQAAAFGASSSATPRATNSSLNFADETLHRPGAGFAERANRPAAGNVVGDPHQVIGILLSALAVGQPMQRLGHPERPSRQGVHWPQLSWA